MKLKKKHKKNKKQRNEIWHIISAVPLNTRNVIDILHCWNIY